MAFGSEKYKYGYWPEFLALLVFVEAYVFAWTIVPTISFFGHYNSVFICFIWFAIGMAVIKYHQIRKDAKGYGIAIAIVFFISINWAGVLMIYIPFTNLGASLNQITLIMTTVWSLFWFGLVPLKELKGISIHEFVLEDILDILS